MKWNSADLRLEYSPPSECRFGITEALGATIAGGLTGVGLGGAAIGTSAAPGLLSLGLGGALEGAGTSALLDAATGRPLTLGTILPGAATGGVLGSGVGAALGEATGLGTTAGDVLAGAGTGAISSLLTNGNPLLGAATGGAGGLAAATLGSGSASTAPTTASPGATTGAGGATAVGAPAALASGTPIDLTTQTAALPAVTDGSPISGGGSASPISRAGTSSILNDVASAGGGGIGANSNILSDVASAGGGGDAAAASLIAGGPPLSPNISPANLSAVESLNAGTGATGAGGILSNVGSLAGKYWPVLAGAGLLGVEALRGNQALPSQGALQSLEGQNASAGAALRSYELTGKLPPGLQSAVDVQNKAAQAQIRSSYASMGLSGSTSEAQALAGVQQQTAATIGKIASDLAQQGISLSSLSSSELTSLLTTEQQQSTQLNQALSTFAAGLAGAGLKAAA